VGERSAQSHWQSPRRRASDEPEPEDLPVDQVSASSVSGKIRPQDSRARVPPCRAACSHLTGRMAKADASRFSCRECRLVPDVPGCPIARATREEVPSSHPAVSPCGAVPRRAKKGPPIQAGLFAWTRGKWRIENGEWGMGNGEWGMAVQILRICLIYGDYYCETTIIRGRKAQKVHPRQNQRRIMS